MANRLVMAAGVFDELSIVFAPVSTGDRNVATIFDAAPFCPRRPSCVHPGST